MLGEDLARSRCSLAGAAAAAAGTRIACVMEKSSTKASVPWGRGRGGVSADGSPVSIQPCQNESSNKI